MNRLTSDHDNNLDLKNRIKFPVEQCNEESTRTQTLLRNNGIADRVIFLCYMESDLMIHGLSITTFK